MRGGVFPGRVRDIDIAPTSQLARATSVRSAPILVAFLGDSGIYGAGGNTGFPGPRGEFYRLLRTVRGDIQLVGTLRDGYPGTGGTPAWLGSRYVLGDFFHEGHSGFKNEDLLAAWSTYKAAYDAAGWTPHAFILSNGANNIAASQSAATAFGHLADLIAAIRASYPAAIVFVGTVPPWPGFAAATATYNVDILALNLPNVVPFEFWGDIDLSEQVNPGGGNGHPTDRANSIGAERAVEVFERYFPVRRGLPFPRASRPRVAQTVLNFTDAGDSAIFGGAVRTGVLPGSGNFAFGFTVWPSALPAGPRTIGGYNILGYNPGGYWLVSYGANVSLFVDGPAARLDAIENLLSMTTPTTLVLVGHPADRTISLWANGLLRQQVQLGSAWSFTAPQYGFLGNYPAVWGALLGSYREVSFASGSAIPAFTDVALRTAIERHYIDGVDLPGTKSTFRLDEASGTALADLAGGTDGGLIAGSGATLGNVKAMPWDWT